ncbi:hypothetical protein R3W88_014796 [Solanum pinnatisectum]|uniref:Endonuclease/exonuclease/phosphatase domain-containing protein n=1 Tax=Solanum pinnatisectum TaxID=50273 RepID=A0AAV9KU31_9SOLN|nr:hypothetical protein R3W88_014796 [Solanum pinnatisectum]
MIQVPAVGKSGGLVVLWDDNLLDIATTSQEIHTMVKIRSTNELWLFSCIYVSNHRNILWQNLKTIKDNYNGKWLIGGDFNELMSNSDKSGGKSISTSRMNDLWDVVNYCELIDMGFKGNRYTWLNKHFKNRSKLIFERLDRFFANNEWLLKIFNYPVLILTIVLY